MPIVGFNWSNVELGRNGEVDPSSVALWQDPFMIYIYKDRHLGSACNESIGGLSDQSAEGEDYWWRAERQ